MIEFEDSVPLSDEDTAAIENILSGKYTHTSQRVLAYLGDAMKAIAQLREENERLQGSCDAWQSDYEATNARLIEAFEEKRALEEKVRNVEFRLRSHGESGSPPTHFILIQWADMLTAQEEK